MRLPAQIPLNIKPSDFATLDEWLASSCQCRRPARSWASTIRGCGPCWLPDNLPARSWEVVGSSHARVSSPGCDCPKATGANYDRPMHGRRFPWRRVLTHNSVSDATGNGSFGSSTTAASKDSSPGFATVRRHSASTATQARWPDSRGVISYTCPELAPPGRTGSGWSLARRSTPTSHTMSRGRSPRSSGWSRAIREQTSFCASSLTRWERRPLDPSRLLPPLRSTWPSNLRRGRHVLGMRFCDASIASVAGTFSSESSSLEWSAAR